MFNEIFYPTYRQKEIKHIHRQTHTHIIRNYYATDTKNML